MKSKAVLEQKLGGKVDLLAWPFGIYDPELMAWAQAAGYVAAFRSTVAPSPDPRTSWRCRAPSSPTPTAAPASRCC